MYTSTIFTCGIKQCDKKNVAAFLPIPDYHT